jgi:hypothetical protein
MKYGYSEVCLQRTLVTIGQVRCGDNVVRLLRRVVTLPRGYIDRHSN